MLVISDGLSYEYYPRYCMPGESARLVALRYQFDPMMAVVEVYDLALDRELQLAERQSLHW